MRRLIGFVLFFSLIQSSYANNPDYNFKHYNPDHGLSQNTILALYEDENGLIWIGTRNGLNVFDGYKFITYLNNPWDSTSLSDNHINDILPGKNHTLWIGTENGLSLYNQESGLFQQFYHVDLIGIGWNVRSMALDGDGNLWMTANHGVFVLPSLSPTDHSSFQPMIHVSDHEFNRCISDFNGQVWFAGIDGVFISDFKNGRFNIVKKKFGYENLDETPSQCILQTDSGYIWISSINYLIKVNLINDQVKFYENKYSDSEISINVDGRDIIEGLDKKIWISTYYGVVIFDPILEKYIDRINHDPKNPKSLSDNSVQDMLISQIGDVWIGSYSGGLNYYSPSQNIFDVMRHSTINDKSLNSNIINTFSEGQDGILYIGTSRGGLNIYDAKTKNFSFELTDVNIRHIQNDKNHLWLGTLNHGLLKYDIKTKKTRNIGLNSSNPERRLAANVTIYHSLIDSENQFWTTEWNTLRLYDPITEDFTTFAFDIEKSVNYHTTKKIIEYQDNLWLLTNVGIQVFDKKEQKFIKSYKHIKEDITSLPDNNLSWGVIDLNGVLWISSFSGVSRYNANDDNFLSLSLEDGMPSNMILCMLVDDKNNIWLSTARGLSILDQKTMKCHVFDETNNLQSTAFRDGACYACKDGKFLFGGINGYNIIDPTNIKKDTVPPKVVLSSLQLFNKRISPGTHPSLPKGISYTDTLILNHDENVFTLAYTALDFSDPIKCQYAYILEGFDQNWNEVGENRSATYTNLSPGTYLFKVKASNSDGVWNEKGVSLIIIIVPPFWQRVWFRLLVLIIFIISIISIHRYRIRELLKQKKWLDITVAQRTNVIAEQKNILEKHNENLLQAEEEVRAANDQLKRVNDHLEEMVEKRTQNIHLQNQKLKEYAFLNSHKVRAPLVRILGLINIYKTGKLSTDELFDVNQKIHDSALELDHITRKINEELDTTIDPDHS